MGVQYVLTEWLCQDSLENYFGQQRDIGRRKDNPYLHDIGYNDNRVRNQLTFKPIIELIIFIIVLNQRPIPKRN